MPCNCDVKSLNGELQHGTGCHLNYSNGTQNGINGRHYSHRKVYDEDAEESEVDRDSVRL